MELWVLIAAIMLFMLSGYFLGRAYCLWKHEDHDDDE